ncbi:Protein of unknown function [Gryllus bimaculatus]|nr:Protein of unknown function [Gryllus bimaculatus]
MCTTSSTTPGWSPATPSASRTRGWACPATSTPPSPTATARPTSSRANSTGASWASGWTETTPKLSRKASPASLTTWTLLWFGLAMERFTSSRTVWTPASSTRATRTSSRARSTIDSTTAPSLWTRAARRSRAPPAAGGSAARSRRIS